MHIHVRSKDQPWPTIPFGTYRLLTNKTAWAEMNPSEGNYNWRVFDWVMSTLKEHGIDDVEYSFTKAPTWASSQPENPCSKKNPVKAARQPKMMGSCAAPSDLNADGSGSDKHWKDFVTAIVTHAQSVSGAHVKYWEVWNEPNHPFYWSGTFPQMVRMSRDAAEIVKRIDPDAKIVSPPVGLNEKGLSWLDGYLAAGGGNSADIIAFHGYIHNGQSGELPAASTIIAGVERYRSVLAKYGQANKPLWDTEASWGDAPGMGFAEDQDFQAAFLAQFYLLHWSENVPRLYWFAWNDFGVGTLWLPGSGPVKAATAYAETYKWLVGSTMTRPCSESDGLWSCELTEPDGRQAEIVWADRGQKSYSPRASFKKMRDLDGGAGAVSGTIRLGMKPVLLEP